MMERGTNRYQPTTIGFRRCVNHWFWIIWFEIQELSFFCQFITEEPPSSMCLLEPISCTVFFRSPKCHQRKHGKCGLSCNQYVTTTWHMKCFKNNYLLNVSIWSFSCRGEKIRTKLSLSMFLYYLTSLDAKQTFSMQENYNSFKVY